MKLTLRPDQQEALEVMLKDTSGGVLNASEQGTGKTLLTVEYLLQSGAQRVLIVGSPDESIIRQWKERWEQQGGTLPFVHVTSDNAEALWVKNPAPGVYYVGRELLAMHGVDKLAKRRKTAIKSATLKPGATIKLVVTGKDVIESKTPGALSVKQKTVSNALHAELTNIAEAPIKIVFKTGVKKLTVTPATKRAWATQKPTFDVFVWDETHRITNRHSEAFRVAKTINAKQRVALTGTPQGNKFMGIWAVTRWLWGNLIDPSTGEKYVDSSKVRWEARWCVVEANRFAHSGVKAIGEKNPGEFVKSLPCYVRLTEKAETGWHGQLAPVREYHTIKLSERERALYDSFEQLSFAVIKDKVFHAPIPITVQIRLRQAALGEFDLVDDEQIGFSTDGVSSKLTKLQEILASSQGRVLVFCASTKWINAYQPLIPHSVSWTGNTPKPERAEIKNIWGQAWVDDDAKVILANPQALNEGVDGLQHHCNTIVWVSELAGNPTLNKQAESRIVRSGQPNRVTIHHIIAEETGDFDWHERNKIGGEMLSEQLPRWN